MSGGPVDWIKIGERLRTIRKESHLSQREFGQHFGVSQNMISLYEKGRSRASVEFYLQVAQFGGRSIEWLLTGLDDHAQATLREMRDLHDKMNDHLAVVCQLLEREADDVLDRTISPIEDSDRLREVLRAEKNIPPCLKELLEDPDAWRALGMTGREVKAFCYLNDTVGNMSKDELLLFLQLVRHSTRSQAKEKPPAPVA